jgi:hypothetical protein
MLASVPSARDPFVLSVNESITEINSLASQLPNRYGWRFRTVDALRAEMMGLTATGEARPFELNRLYWTDALKTCEAYTLMSTWRIIELGGNAVGAISRNERVCAALVGRAVLESVAQYVDAARTITSTIEPILSTNLTANVVVSTDLENYLLKTVYASRIPGTEEFYWPTNIVTVINRIAKVHGQAKVKSHYDILCEVAHPNLLGRSVYLMSARPGVREGDEIREMGLDQGPTSLRVLDSAIWSLAWAIATQVSAVHLMQSTIQRFVRLLRPAEMQ